MQANQTMRWHRSISTWYLYIHVYYLVSISSLTLSSQIPKPNETEGLGISWPQQKTDMDGLKALCEEIKSKM